MVPDRIRQRYLQDPLPMRLGGLAADLARISDCVVDHRDRCALMSLLEEGKYLAEWAAPDASLEIQAELADIQILLALWQRRWLTGRPEPRVAEEARKRSARLLELAGLSS